MRSACLSAACWPRAPTVMPRLPASAWRFAGICHARSSAVVGFSSCALVLMTSLSGLFVGIAIPSRDMLVRAVTPRGAFGRVFGFVSSGFNIGSMIAPTDLRNDDGSRPAAGRVSVFGRVQHSLHRHGDVWLFGPAATRSRSLSRPIIAVRRPSGRLWETS